MQKLFYWLSAVLFLVSCCVLGGCTHQKEPPVAEKGILDLRHWDFEEGPIHLKGEWAFYWHQMIPPENLSDTIVPKHSGMLMVPGFWNGFKPEEASGDVRENTKGQAKAMGSGFGTYHLRIMLPDNSKEMAVKILDMATAYVLYANGEKVANSGIPGTTRDTSVPRYHPKVADLAIPGEILDLVVHVSNFHHWQGGMWESILLGQAQEIHGIRERTMARDFFLLGTILMMGLYHLGLFFIRRENRSTLYFGLFNFMVAIRLMFTGERFFVNLVEGIGYWGMMVAVYISFYLSVPLFALYMRNLFPGEVLKSFVHVSVLSGILFSVFVLFAPLPLFTMSMVVFELITLILLGYSGWAVGLAIVRKRQGILGFLGGFLILFAAIVNDILYSRQFISTAHIAPLGVFIFIFFQAFILSQRFSQAFMTVERQGLELARTNETYQEELANRIQAQADLKASEAQYRELIEKSADGICIVRQGAIVYANPRFMALSGMEQGDLGSIPFLTFIDSRDHEKILNRYNETVPPDKFPGYFAIRGLNKNGIVHHLELNASIIDWESSPAVITFVRDVTERTRTRELLVQSEKMLSVGGLAAGMAHEINNPLAGMIQNAQLVKNRLSPGGVVNEKIAGHLGLGMDKVDAYAEKRDIFRLLGHILAAGQSAADIVTNMLSFARKSSNQKEAWALESIVEKTLALVKNDFELKKQYDFKDIRIEKKYDSDMSQAQCQEVKIRQVLLNLFKNAAQSMNTPGHVNLSPKIIIRLFQDGQWACISIKDNGPGLEESVRKRVFEPFYTTKVTNVGTGLGLSVSYFIITEDHGGQMDVVSEPGQGSEFIVRLPLA